MKFKVESKFKPAGDQPQAIEKLSAGVKNSLRDQVLLGVTGSGKTFTMAKVVEQIQKPTLIISHNKTLAAQLYSEFKEFFPNNAVHYFVSYYDYYQPEAYMPQTDTYIEKDAKINEEIDRLRHASTAALLSRPDTLIVASVSCIYGIGEPAEYLSQSINIAVGQILDRDDFIKELVDVQYERNDFESKRGNFRVRGEMVDIFPPYEENGVRVLFDVKRISKITILDPIAGHVLEEKVSARIFPAKHFVTTEERIKSAFEKIKIDLKKQTKVLKSQGKELEAKRLETRTNFDLEMMAETGWCHGIENYSLYLSGRKPGDIPYTLIHFFGNDFLTIIDESHMTIPQIGGMYRGDRARKETLIEHGFRLPSALDNRPLKFNEFNKLVERAIYVSATPGGYEIEKATGGSIQSAAEYSKKRQKKQEFTGISEQLIRPTGLIDPKIEIKPTKFQVDDLLAEIQKAVEKKERVLVTTLTKRMAEDLSEYLIDLGIKAAYLHSEIKTLERPEILRDLRLGKYDVVVGINLLREGLDLPEVSLVAIFDADKEGFLRNDVSLIQTIGRAARHASGRVIMYADTMTGSIKRAVAETDRRRKIQEKYNKKHGITPQSIKKAIRKDIVDVVMPEAPKFDVSQIPPDELSRILKDLEKQMKVLSRNLEFEKAAQARDQISEIKKRFEEKEVKKLLKTT